MLEELMGYRYQIGRNNQYCLLNNVLDARNNYSDLKQQ